MPFVYNIPKIETTCLTRIFRQSGSLFEVAPQLSSTEFFFNLA